ncbi:coatomer subunit, partial [Colletotrichum scovillei]
MIDENLHEIYSSPSIHCSETLSRRVNHAWVWVFPLMELRVIVSSLLVVHQGRIGHSEKGFCRLRGRHV